MNISSLAISGMTLLCEMRLGKQRSTEIGKHVCLTSHLHRVLFSASFLITRDAYIAEKKGGAKAQRCDHVIDGEEKGSKMCSGDANYL